ncbi:hypothetical protein, partial [Leptospira alexanderi]
MKLRFIGIVFVGVSILFVFNFSLLEGIRNFFSLALPSEETRIPQAMPKLNVDSFGKTSFSYPIAVPPGAGDVVPKLTILYYSSPSDGGILGKGFSLEGIPVVQVNPSYGWSESDTRFISSLGGEFVS